MQSDWWRIVQYSSETGQFRNTLTTAALSTVYKYILCCVYDYFKMPRILRSTTVRVIRSEQPHPHPCKPSPLFF